MSPESDSVRIARIEEGLVAHRGESRENFKAIMKVLDPLVIKVQMHHEDLIRRKQNDKWIYTLLLLGPTSLAAAFEVWFHFKALKGG